MPSDRQKSLFFNMSVAANISARLERKDLSARRGLVSRRMLAGAAESYIERFGIKAAHAGASVASLSGGNQQKVALASALAVDPALLIIEEPTRGVDLQTKRQIYDILKRFAASGGAVVMYVTELEDAIGCADHLYVVRDQTIVGLVEVGTAGGLEKLGIAVTRLLGRDADAA
jgi:ABC-type sugar transport system ATPase subunit